VACRWDLLSMRAVTLAPHKRHLLPRLYPTHRKASTEQVVHGEPHESLVRSLMYSSFSDRDVYAKCIQHGLVYVGCTVRRRLICPQATVTALYVWPVSRGHSRSWPLCRASLRKVRPCTKRTSATTGGCMIVCSLPAASSGLKNRITRQCLRSVYQSAPAAPSVLDDQGSSAAAA